MNKKLLTTSVFLATSIAMAFEPWIGSSTTAGYWFVKDDYEEGGKSKVVWPVATGDEAPLSPIIDFCKGVCGTAKLNKGTLTYNPFVTVGFNVAGKYENGNLANGKASDWGGICITYRSDAAPSLELSMGDADDAAIGYALPTKKLEKSENGESYRTCIPWSNFVQPSWGKENTKISGTEAAAKLVSINFKMQESSGQYKFNICAIGPYSAGSDNLPKTCSTPPTMLTIHPEISVSAKWSKGNDGYDATITVKDGEKELTEGTDYEIETNVNNATGIVLKTITGKGDYAGSVVKPLVPYIDENGEPQVMYDATVLTNNKDGVTELNGGWYVATGKVNMAGIKFNGEAHLILADDAEMVIETEDEAGIYALNNLTIYGQTEQNGILKATGYYDGIYSENGNITISGGSVTATGSNYYGIYGYEGVTISGGSVTADGNSLGIYSENGNITISGGSVTATGDNTGIYSYEGVSISGGTVEATGNYRGIYSNGDITLGWTNDTDRIKASSYQSVNGSVQIAKGKSLKDEKGNVYSGTLTKGQVSDLQGQKLEPFKGKSVSFVNNFGETSVVFAKIAIDGEGKVAAPAKHPIRTGYTFAGWFTAPNGGSEFDFTVSVTVNTIAYAHWNENTTSVKYIDENGKTQILEPGDYTVLTNDIYVEDLPEGWYVVEGEVKYTSTVSFSGNAHLILADGAKMEIESEGGDGIDAWNNLTIYGQSNQNGILNATGGDYGIYSNSYITINGGTVTASSNHYGISSDNGVTINGGTVTATGKYFGINCDGIVTIGGGSVTASGNQNGIFSRSYLTISGGSVVATATSGMYSIGIYGYNKVTISGGSVTATGKDYGIYSNSGDITIIGGKVEATGYDGIFSSKGNITISGGSVTATSNYRGIYSNGVTISGGSVAATASGPNSYGIYSNSGDITISGGMVTATSNNNGIYSSNGVTISGGTVTATGNYRGIYSNGDITLGWTNSTDFIYASSYSLGDNEKHVSIAKDKSFKDDKGNEYSSGTIDDISDIAGKTLVPPSFEGKFLSDVNIAVADIPVQKYADGKPVCPSVVVTDGKDTLTAGTDYTVTCVNNTAVTSANLDEAAIAQITGKGNYAGAIQKRFFIWENIRDYAAVQVFQDAVGKTHAEIDGAYDGTDAVAIDENFENVAVKFNREFTVNLENGGFSTIMLPFDVSASNLTGVKSILEFEDVDNNTVRVNYVWCNATIGQQQFEKGNPNCNNELSGELKAYTPYLIEMDTTTLGIKDNVTLKPSNNATNSVVSKSNWVFRGVLQKKDFSENDQAIQKGIIWAFAGSARKGASIGKFVQFGGNNWVNPFRAYLVDCTTYPDASECKDDETQSEPSFVSRYRFADVFAPASSAENSLSAKVPMRVAASETASLEGMEVVIMNGDKERPTVIGRMNPATGEIRMLPRTKQTYDLKGRRVNEGRKAKGAYYRK